MSWPLTQYNIFTPIKKAGICFETNFNKLKNHWVFLQPHNHGNKLVIKRIKHSLWEIKNMYRVSFKLQKQKWTFGRTRNAVGTSNRNTSEWRTRNAVETRAIRRVFPQLFTQRTSFLSLLENTTTKKRKLKQLDYFDYQNVHSVCLCHEYINSMC